MVIGYLGNSVVYSFYVFCFSYIWFSCLLFILIYYVVVVVYVGFCYCSLFVVDYLVCCLCLIVV